MGVPTARPPPGAGGKKTKIFLSFFLVLGGGVGGEPTKNGKEIFGFASPLQKLSLNEENSDWNHLLDK